MKRALMLLFLFPAAGLVSPAEADTAQGAIQGRVWQRGGKLVVHLGAGERTVDAVRLDLVLGSPAVILPPDWKPGESQPFGVQGKPSSQVVVGFDLPPDTRVPGKLRIEALSGGETVYKEKVEIVDSPHPQPAADPADLVKVPPLLTPGGQLIVGLARGPEAQTVFLPELVSGVNLTWGTGEDLATVPLAPADPDKPWLGDFSGRLPKELPAAPQIDVLDGFGESLYTGSLEVQLVPATTWPQTPVLSGVSDKAVVGSTLCVSGYVPDVGGWSRLQLGGTPLGQPRYASNLVAGFDVRALLPARYRLGSIPNPEEPVIDEDLGLWRKIGDGPAGEPEGGGLWTEIIQIDAGIRQESIRTGQKTVVYFNVLGTQDPMPFDLELVSKGVGKLEGGNRQTATTSGGETNGFEREVEGLKPGEFNINWSTDAGNCPGAKAPPAGEAPAGLDPDLEKIYADAFLQLFEESKEAKVEPPVVAPADPTDPCAPTPRSLCLKDGRFRVEVDWTPGLQVPPAVALRPVDDSGFFFFSDPENWELLLKVLDGCRSNDHFWVFYAATTDVEYTLTVTDTQSGARRVYDNPLGQPAPAIVDTQAFATCP